MVWIKTNIFLPQNSGRQRYVKSVFCRWNLQARPSRHSQEPSWPEKQIRIFASSSLPPNPFLQSHSQLCSKSLFSPTFSLQRSSPPNVLLHHLFPKSNSIRLSLRTDRPPRTNNKKKQVVSLEITPLPNPTSSYTPIHAVDHLFLTSSRPSRSCLHSPCYPSTKLQPLFNFCHHPQDTKRILIAHPVFYTVMDPLNIRLLVIWISKYWTIIPRNQLYQKLSVALPSWFLIESHTWQHTGTTALGKRNKEQNN